MGSVQPEHSRVRGSRKLENFHLSANNRSSTARGNGVTMIIFINISCKDISLIAVSIDAGKEKRKEHSEHGPVVGRKSIGN